MEDREKMQRTRPNAVPITPSQSPPHSPHSRRIPDQPSPTKRPRLSSAPRQIQRASSSSSTPVDTFNFHRAREESAIRLFDVWAGLAERYSRPLDEDDIIDITTGKVVKDRGVLRGSQTCTVGAFADPTPEDAEDDLEEDEEEDEIDELDSFANPAMRGMDALPLVDRDARDAQDLKEFLEAEQRRREIYGSETDETEGSVYESQPEDIPAVGESDRDVSQEGSEGGQTSDRPPEPIYVDSGSEDELGGWDLKEASAVYRLRKDEDIDSEVEEVLDKSMQPTQMSPEVPLPPWTSPVTRPRRVSNQRQLQTPPQSQSDPSATPDDFSTHPPPTSPPRSSSPFSQYDSSPIKSPPAARGSKRPVSEGKRTIPSGIQPKHPSRPIPRLDLTKASAKPSIKSKHVLHTPSTSPKAYSPDSGNARKPPKTTSVQSANLTKGKPKQPTSDAEVAIRQRTPFRVPSQRRSGPPKENEIERKQRPTAKVKGKQKALSIEESAQSYEEELPRSSPPLASKSGPSRSRRLSVTPSASRVAELSLDDPGSSRKPKPIPLAKQLESGKKRKRIVSSAETVAETRASSPDSPTEDIRRNSSTSRSGRRSSNAFDKPEITKESSSRRRDKHKHTPQRRSYSAESESEEDEVEQDQRHSSRAPSHFNAPYHPYPPPLYPPHHPPDQQQPIYTPLQDPRAQYIFTQAMQQIFALGTGAWAPHPPPSGRSSTPFTPKHHQRHRGDPPLPHMYSTPMHHPHPYPYSYDPMLSNATLPPESPEVPPSSPGTSTSGGQRRKSLVRRSQSRGRRVSFREEESDIDALGGPDPDSDGADSPSRRHASGSGSKEYRKKGKDKARDEVLMSDSEAEPEPTSNPILRRGRPSSRYQTPGPGSREQGPARDVRRAPSAYQSQSKSHA